MRKKILVLIGAVLLMVLGYLSFGFFKIDACLDKGGCWDKTHGICRITEENAQELCSK